MSDYDLDKIHEQSSAILEKLYNEKGQPGEFDEDFIQEFFDLVQDSLNLKADVKRPQPSDAKLFEPSSGLIEVFEHSAKKKFVVSRLNAVKILRGSSKNYGVNEGKGRYRMAMVDVGKRFKVPMIGIKSESGGVVIFIGSPNIVNNEQGRGEWEKVQE